MNIIITLPAHYINDIIEGRKTIEVRKTFPRDFDVNNDVVFITSKGTKHVPLVLKLSHIEMIVDKQSAWNMYSEQICCSHEYWIRYAEKFQRPVYFWFIERWDWMKSGSRNYACSYDFCKTAPQSFAYTNYRLHSQTHVFE